MKNAFQINLCVLNAEIIQKFKRFLHLCQSNLVLWIISLFALAAIQIVCDPAYVKYHYPNWYTDLYGDKTPEEAIYKEGGCWDSFINDPDEKYYCYDDEDK